MELLLNLLWLTLAAPAVWIWSQPVQARHSYGHGRLGSCLVLVCVLMLLFPVVSASDDLHPMRPEMEESNPFKRTVKQSSGGASASWLSNPGSFFARSFSDSPTFPGREVCALILLSSFIFPELLTSGRRDSRAPPAFLLG
jgi:hypothetical protein